MKRVLAVLLILTLTLSGCALTTREELPVLDATPKQDAPEPTDAVAPSAEPEPMSANEAIESGAAPDPEKEAPFEAAAFEAPPTHLETAPPQELPEMPSLPQTPEGSGTGDGNEETAPDENPNPIAPPEDPPAEPPATPDAPPAEPATGENPPAEPPAAVPETPQPEVDYRFALGQKVDYNTVYSHLYAFTKQIGSRRVGTNGNYAARQYILSQLSAWGFSEADVRCGSRISIRPAISIPRISSHPFPATGQAA